MKRREFLMQSVSAGAVVLGAGYASIDMLIRRRAQIDTPLEQRAVSAAVKVLAAENPTMDEGMQPVIQPIANATNTPLPSTPTHARPALSYKQQELAESWMGEYVEQQVIAKQEPVEEIVVDTSKAATEDIAQPQASAKTVQEKVENFETNFTDDVILSEADYAMLVQTLERINRVQDYIGFGNFNVVSFDEALKYGKHSPRIGEFTKEELAFMEKLFSYDSSKLGFYGEKVVPKMTNALAGKDIKKIPRTGHWLFRGYSETFYNKIRTEVGDSLILTSGVRNIVKQYQLFMAKTVQAKGNLSRASRSLAPPGHSYHAVGDFDVGQVGAGFDNFTTAFAKTDEFKRLQDLGYVQIRYTESNDLGVRYEPWHIRVV